MENVHKYWKQFPYPLSHFMMKDDNNEDTTVTKMCDGQLHNLYLISVPFIVSLRVNQPSFYCGL